MRGGLVEAHDGGRGGPCPGLGPRLTRVDGHAWFGHGGADEGFLTTVEAGVDDGSGVVVMASSTAAGPLMTAVAGAVAEMLGWAPAPGPAEAPPRARPSYI